MLISSETIYDVVREMGIRVIIAAGWAGLGEGGVPSDLEGQVYILTSES